MAGNIFRFTTYSAAASDANTISIDVGSGGPMGSSTAGDQILGISAIGNSAVGAATLKLFWYDTVNELVIASELITVAGTSEVAHKDGSTTTSGYVCTTIGYTTQNFKADIIRVGKYLDRRTGTGLPTPDANVELRIGCISLTTFTTLDVRVMPTRTI